ncbi:DUF4198 domain-containing protein [Shewanella sp. AS16]|uniref:DUF4198 domain-containing protein n=1 Tax=Shewanella sp. AS16 TaxID=2907625 RepID=UPI001F3F6ECE|nr:DUF4198 domain-containing protein [Shewanella sp. AS16]MCE9687452.1 DUF4198 domain-containing protein [Shewanella sp. AS16]
MLGLFKKSVDVEVFPEVSGRITHQGQAVAGLKLKRGYNYVDAMDETAWDYTVTDDEGRFTFPELTMKSKHPNRLFVENRIIQMIKLDDGRYKEYEDAFIWGAKSRGVKHIAYFVDRLARLNCDLVEPEMVHQIIDEEFPDGSVRYEVQSICRWPELEAIEVEKRKKYGEW